MLRTPMVVQTVPLRRGWYQVAVDFREGNPELWGDSNVVLNTCSPFAIVTISLVAVFLLLITKVLVTTETCLCGH
jgi:hypothetical protein